MRIAPAILLLAVGACARPQPVVIPIPPPVPAPTVRAEHVQMPSRRDVQDEAEYRQLKADLRKTKEKLRDFDRAEGYPP